jgi:hypothetical protein
MMLRPNGDDVTCSFACDTACKVASDWGWGVQALLEQIGNAALNSARNRAQSGLANTLVLP